MALRVGIDLDGTIADLSTAYHLVERALFPARGDAAPSADEEEIEEGEEEAASTPTSLLAAAKHEARERDLIWRAIRNTENFWEGLQPTEPGVVRALYEASLTLGWETYFITQRPGCAGRTVQRQTQLWLEREGFERPSVLTLSGGRGRAAAALELDFLVDDTPKNCVDVIAESRCRPILILRTPSAAAEAAAKQLGFSVTRSVAEAIPYLEAPAAQRAGLVKRLFGRGAARSNDFGT